MAKANCLFEPAGGESMNGNTMYLEKIVCAGLFLFLLGIALNVATLVSVIKTAHDDSARKTPTDHLIGNVE